MKKVLFSLFFICLFLFPCLADYTVDQATVNAEVAQNGKTKVTATYQLTFDSQQDQVQIPLPDGDISRVSAETYRYKVDKTDAGVDVVLSKGTFSGTQSFTISYTVNVSPDSSTDGDVFTLGLLSSRWGHPVGRLCLSGNAATALRHSPRRLYHNAAGTQRLLWPAL